MSNINENTLFVKTAYVHNQMNSLQLRTFSTILIIITEFISTNGVTFSLMSNFLHHWEHWSICTQSDEMIQFRHSFITILIITTEFISTNAHFSYIKLHWKHNVCIDRTWTQSSELIQIKHTSTTILIIITEIISTKGVTSLLC